MVRFQITGWYSDDKEIENYSSDDDDDEKSWNSDLVRLSLVAERGGRRTRNAGC